MRPPTDDSAAIRTRVRLGMYARPSEGRRPRPAIGVHSARVTPATVDRSSPLAGSAGDRRRACARAHGLGAHRAGGAERPSAGARAAGDDDRDRVASPGAGGGPGRRDRRPGARAARPGGASGDRPFRRRLFGGAVQPQAAARPRLAARCRYDRVGVGWCASGRPLAAAVPTDGARVASGQRDAPAGAAGRSLGRPRRAPRA